MEGIGTFVGTMVIFMSAATTSCAHHAISTAGIAQYSQLLASPNTEGRDCKTICTVSQANNNRLRVHYIQNTKTLVG